MKKGLKNIDFKGKLKIVEKDISKLSKNLYIINRRLNELKEQQSNLKDKAKIVSLNEFRKIKDEIDSIESIIKNINFDVIKLTEQKIVYEAKIKTKNTNRNYK